MVPPPAARASFRSWSLRSLLPRAAISRTRSSLITAATRTAALARVQRANMAGIVDVYMAKLAEQAERYDESMRASPPH